tara:strand:- start:63225 stop:63668 length:444 start_codon:yes stop_codon:yes gene_type:complete
MLEIHLFVRKHFMANLHAGSCLCGSVKFEIVGEFKKFFLCHCSRCRKTSGSAHCANLFAPGAQLHWLSGEEKISFYKHEGTNFAKNFCSVCSALLPVDAKAREMVVVPAGCLDTDVDITPQAHLCTDSKGNWDNIMHDVQCFANMPG